MSKDKKTLINVQTGIRNVNCGQAVAPLGSDPNSGQGLRAGQQRITDLGSDPDGAGRGYATQLIATYAGYTGAGGRFGLKNGRCCAGAVIPAPHTIRQAGSGSWTVKRGAAVAQWGSDPNSGQGVRAGQQRITDLGSDPDWAGRDNTMQLIAACAYGTGAGGRFDIKTWSQPPLYPVLTTAHTEGAT